MKNQLKQAFPVAPKMAWDDESANGYLGVDKREYFAGLAMQGLLTRVPNRADFDTDLGVIEGKRIAAEARIMAEYLLLELDANP